AEAVDRDCTARVVHLRDVVPEPDAAADDDASGETDEGGRPWRDEGTRGRDRHQSRKHAVAGHRDVRLTVDERGERHRGDAGEDHRAVTQVPAVADLRQPAAAPEPVAIDGVDDGAKEKLGYYKRLEVDPLRDGADDDVARGLHEDDLEEEEGQSSYVIGVA